MNQTAKHNLARIAFIVLASILLYGFMGCSASYHLEKFQKKGGVCGKIDTIRITRFDTITNTYYHFDSILIVNDRVVPLTRTEIRYNERLRRDTINHKETIIKYLTKQEKIKEKPEKINAWANVLWILVFVFGLIAVIILLIKKK